MESDKLPFENKKGLRPGKRIRRKRNRISSNQAEAASAFLGAAIGGIFAAMINGVRVVDLKQKPEVVDFEEIGDEGR